MVVGAVHLRIALGWVQGFVVRFKQNGYIRTLINRIHDNNAWL